MILLPLSYPSHKISGTAHAKNTQIVTINPQILASKHVPHEEMLGQSNATQFGQFGDRSRLIHDDHSRCFQPSWICHAGPPLASAHIRH